VVVGAGPFGLTAAAHLTLEGHDVTLLGRPGAHPRAGDGARTVRLTGALGRRTVTLEKVATDPAEAVPGREVVVFAAPGAWFEDTARSIAPFLEDGQLILVNRGLCGVALRLSHILAAVRSTVRLVIAETSAPAYLARRVDADGLRAADGAADGAAGGAPGDPGAAAVGAPPEACGEAVEIEVHLAAGRAALAAFPAADTDRALAAAVGLYPGLGPAGNVLETSLLGPAAILYPPVALLNAGRIRGRVGDEGRRRGEAAPDDAAGCRSYREWVTPAVAETMHAADEERVTLLRALGFQALGLLDWLAGEGWADPGAAARQSFYEVFAGDGPLARMRVPLSLDDDDLHDAVACGLVPMVEVGRLIGVATPVMEALVTLGSLAAGRSYQTVGLTADRMGLPRELWKLGTFLERGVA